MNVFHNALFQNWNWENQRRFDLRPSIHGLVTEIQVNVNWKYVVEADLSKLTYVEY